jgi:hypothetical protein
MNTTMNTMTMVPRSGRAISDVTIGSSQVQEGLNDSSTTDSQDHQLFFVTSYSDFDKLGKY